MREVYEAHLARNGFSPEASSILTQGTQIRKHKTPVNALLRKGYLDSSMLVNADLTHRVSPARAAAFDTLELVSKGAYASDSLRERTSHLKPRDAGLAGQIVFGCLRFQAQLDHLVGVFSGKSVSELDKAVVLSLRMATFQLRYLERIPPHAAIHEAVEIIKVRRRPAAGFVNAVLRKLNRDPIHWPSREIELSCPEWLIARWAAHFGKDQAERLAAEALREPDAYIRVHPGAPVPEGATLEPTAVPGCFRLSSGIPAGVRLHDISSQAILALLDLQAGQSYLDLCAAPGNKTVEALETPLALVIACDISPLRIRDIPPLCPRVVLDATQPLPFLRKFDRIFIDAPCTGTGTLARNPEIKWRVQEQDFERFTRRQREIVGQAVHHLAPGGKLLYATCSLEREENEAVVHQILEADTRLRCENQLWRLPGRDPGDGFFAAVLCFRT